jgi:hypothetical protein
MDIPKAAVHAGAFMLTGPSEEEEEAEAEEEKKKKDIRLILCESRICFVITFLKPEHEI